MFGNMGKMMKLAAQMKTRLPQMQQELAERQYTAVAGGGVVQAVVNGNMQLVDMKMDSSLLADEAMDAEMLADLVVAAVSAAQQQATAAAADAMRELTGGMELPGMDSLLG